MRAWAVRGIAASKLMMSKCAIDVFGKAIGFLLLIKSPLPPFFKGGCVWMLVFCSVKLVLFK
jgi:hypothetical protein